MTQVLNDDQLRARLSMSDAMAVMREVFAARAEERVIAPPRFRVDARGGSLVFTAGGVEGPGGVLGFRCYDTFPHPSTDTDQLVAAFSSEDGALLGVAIGAHIGVLRTAAINGVAVDWLARADARTLGVLGCGFHARWHVEAALTARPGIERVRVYARTPARRDAFAREVEARHGLPVEACIEARAVVAEACVLLCCTNSTTPVLEPEWVGEGTHVNTIGPKRRGASEVPPELAARCAWVVTDAPAQVAALGDDGFLAPLGIVPAALGPATLRRSAQERTLFCSSGLAGTEVALLAEALRRGASG